LGEYKHFSKSSIRVFIVKLTPISHYYIYFKNPSFFKKNFKKHMYMDRKVNLTKLKRGNANPLLQL